MTSKRKNKILYDHNIVYYSSNFRLRIYGRDKNEDNKITLRVEFKEKLPTSIPHLLNKVEPSFLSEFFTTYEEEPDRKIYFRGEIINDNKIRNQVVKFQLRKLKNVTIEDIIDFVASDKYTIEDNPLEVREFLETEYKDEWNKIFGEYESERKRKLREQEEKEKQEKEKEEELSMKKQMDKMKEQNMFLFEKLNENFSLKEEEDSFFYKKHDEIDVAIEKEMEKQKKIEENEKIEKINKMLEYQKKRQQMLRKMKYKKT